MATVGKLLQARQEKVVDTGNKVTVVGVGQVGMATVFSLLTQVSGQCCLIARSFLDPKKFFVLIVLILLEYNR